MIPERPRLEIHAETPTRRRQSAAPQNLETSLTRLSNRLHPDGRIYLREDAEGRLVAVSVPPHAPQFWDNIEPGIRPVIRALRDKRYLTFSSCQGHSLWEWRFVAVAFQDEADREALCRPLEQARIPLLQIRRPESINNIKLTLDSGIVTAERVDSVPAEIEIEGFNRLFGRNYQRYAFAQILIGSPAPEFWLWQLNPLWWRQLWYKWRRWDALTARVAALIDSAAVPKYRF